MSKIVEALLLLRLPWLVVLLPPIGVGYLFEVLSSQHSSFEGKLCKSQISCSRFGLKALPVDVGRACETVVGQVEDEAELEDDALETEEVVDKKDDTLSDGSKLKLVLELICWYDAAM